VGIEKSSSHQQMLGMPGESRGWEMRSEGYMSWGPSCFPTGILSMPTRGISGPGNNKQTKTPTISAVCTEWCPSSWRRVMPSKAYKSSVIVDVVCIYIGDLLFSQLTRPTTLADMNLRLSFRCVGAQWSGVCQQLPSWSLRMDMFYCMLRIDNVCYLGRNAKVYNL
jgi:hypothetical protein